MTLPTDALSWNGAVIGGPGDDAILAEGIEGLGHPGVSPRQTPRANGGSFGGTSYPNGRTVTANAWADINGDPDRIWRIYEAMAPRPHPADVLPLAWSGLMWPEGEEWCVFARPTRCEWLTDEDGVYGGAPGLDLQWVCDDPVAYTYEQTNAVLVATGDPQSSAAGEAPNPGITVPWARRAYELRFTAHGTTTAPSFRVDHADGSWERIHFPTLTMTGGQVLTLGADRMPRVGQAIVNGHARFSSSTTPARRRPLWPRLLPSDGDDLANVITMSVATGAFSGFCKVRGTR